MEYEVQLAPLDKIIATPAGPFEPLCNSCTAPDCTNPIREITVSVLGIPKKHRVWAATDTMVRQVTSCKGYIGNAIPPMGNQPGNFPKT